MAWYSDELPDNGTLLGCIIGGGDKEEEFVLRYRQYQPADSSAFDPYYQNDQVFGPNYSDEGQSFSTTYETLYDLSLMYEFEDLHTGLLTSPINPADLISPWGP
ncbi:MAG: hypothetical protein GY855_11125 [candidate division Zixibacteria bacterium]|nr:hypothetical protein [candidate division Zixibacteria bacterium]